MNRTLQRVTWSRPLVIIFGGLAAAGVNLSLREGSLLAVLVASFAGATLAIALFSLIPRIQAHAAMASPVVGMVGWALFATFTGGLKSPFVAVFLLEIVLAGLVMGPRGVALVTATVIAAISGIFFLYGMSEPWLIGLEMIFVIATGVLGTVMSRRRTEDETALRSQGRELGERLDSLQRELEDERVISRVGENVARLAHGLKNAVHSLRGFVSLIEGQLERGPGTNAALVGLHTAIDDLEKLARLTLDESGNATSASGSGADISAVSGPRTLVSGVVTAARAEVESANPGFSWQVRAGQGAESFAVAIAPNSLLELLVILMRNAVEATGDGGDAEVEYEVRDDVGMITVMDRGAGFASEILAEDLQPGRTTKAKGSGFGLFLGRRVVEDHGGRLILANREGGGACVRVELPALGTSQVTTGAAE